jgi:hypothetical protein
MLSVIWTCTARVFRTWSGFSGLIATVLGILKSIGLDIPGISVIPAWVWWIGAIVLLFVTAVHLEHELKKAREKGAKPEPDMSLAQVIVRMTGASEPQSLRLQLPRLADSVTDALVEIREKASLNLISVWGRKGTPAAIPISESSVPKVLIPKEHWQDFHISFPEFMKDQRGRTRTTDGFAYFDLWFNKAEIDQFWPATKRRTSQFQNPIQWAKRH